MFNPFLKFEPQYIARLLRMNKQYLVSQSYDRAIDHFSDDRKTNILLTDYDDIDYAKIHLGALRDKYKSIIDLKNEKHKAKLISMLSEDSEYLVWWAVIKESKDVEARMNLKYASHIRRYIARETNWRIGSDETIKPQLECIFGELFLNLKRGAQKLKVKLEDIEKS